MTWSPQHQLPNPRQPIISPKVWWFGWSVLGGPAIPKLRRWLFGCLRERSIWWCNENPATWPIPLTKKKLSTDLQGWSSYLKKTQPQDQRWNGKPCFRQFLGGCRPTFLGIETFIFVMVLGSKGARYLRNMSMLYHTTEIVSINVVVPCAVLCGHCFAGSRTGHGHGRCFQSCHNWQMFIHVLWEEIRECTESRSLEVRECINLKQYAYEKCCPFLHVFILGPNKIATQFSMEVF